MVFERLFGYKKKNSEIEIVDPGINFGRYSDNNKSVEKVNRWTVADELFRKDEYPESLEAFFDYLRDDEQANVIFERNGQHGSFQIFQGSKVVRGNFNDRVIQAKVSLAAMPGHSIPVMRRLLEMNFHLHYSRYSLEENTLCMRFDSDIRTANPNKLYYGLKELATKADKQDDLLVQEFSSLKPIDMDHVQTVPLPEMEIKFEYLQKWINTTLEYVSKLDADKFSGGIAYLLLTVAFRIDYLISPEGKLMNELEKVVEKYYRKEEKSTMEKNQKMIEGLQKLARKSKEEIFPYLFRSKHTFSIVSPQGHKTVVETLNNAMQNMYWYRDNNYPVIANEVMEYGLAFSQFSYSLPKPVNDLYKLFMKVNHSDFFVRMGFKPQLFDPSANAFEKEAITAEINVIISRWKDKYPKLSFDTTRLKFDSMVIFNQSLINEITQMNLDS